MKTYSVVDAFIKKHKWLRVRLATVAMFAAFFSVYTSWYSYKLMELKTHELIAMQNRNAEMLNKNAEKQNKLNQILIADYNRRAAKAAK